MKRTLCCVGFFFECFGGAGGPSLTAAVRPSKQPDEDEIAAYLDQGVIQGTIMGMARDVLSPERAIIGLNGDRDVMTDGVWAWPSFLSYYVRKYHVELPREFRDHAEANHWTIPNNIDVEKLTMPWVKAG